MSDFDTSRTSISLFGPLRIRTGRGFCPLKLSGATRELLAFLLSRTGEATRRDVLVAHLWPETTQEKGRSALNTALWRINKSLSGVAGLKVETFDDLVMMQVDADVCIDAQRLHALSVKMRRSLNDGQAVPVKMRRALADLMETCNGIYLDGFDSQWALEERGRLEALRMRCLDTLMHEATSRGALDDALDWGQTILASDPLRETVYHDMMQLYFDNGERRRAIMLYETLRQVLHDELQVTPDPATTALRNEIVTDHAPRSAPRRKLWANLGTRQALS